MSQWGTTHPQMGRFSACFVLRMTCAFLMELFLRTVCPVMRAKKGETSPFSSSGGTELRMSSLELRIQGIEESDDLLDKKRWKPCKNIWKNQLRICHGDDHNIKTLTEHPEKHPVNILSKYSNLKIFLLSGFLTVKFVIKSKNPKLFRTVNDNKK